MKVPILLLVGLLFIVIAELVLAVALARRRELAAWWHREVVPEWWAVREGLAQAFIAYGDGISELARWWYRRAKWLAAGRFCDHTRLSGQDAVTFIFKRQA